MSATSFQVVPDSLFHASLKFLDLQGASGRILGGLGQGLGSSGGMAGNDDAGRAFAARYNPAGQSVSNGLVSGNKQLGDIADGLLAMAFNYLQAEMGSNFMVPQAMGGGPQRSCRTDEQAVAVPAAVGAGQESSLPLIGQFWPQGDPERLRHAATTWRQVATLTEELGRRGATVVIEATNGNSGKAIDAFAESWTPMARLLSEIATTSRALAVASETYAQRIDDQRLTIEAIGATIAIATTAGIVLTIFTLGGSDVVAAGSDAALVAAAADAAITFEIEVAGAGEVAALVGADAAVEGAIVTLPAIAPIAAEAELVGVSASSLEMVASVVPPGVVLFLNNVQDVAAADNVPPMAPMSGDILDPLLNGAVPPQPGSPFAPLSPQQQAAAVAWVRGLPSDPLTNVADWADYQRRVAGPFVYTMPTGGLRPVNADGFRPLDGAIIEAKYVRESSCSVYNLDNKGKVFDIAYENAFASTGDEFNRYGQAIAYPSSEARFLEVETNDPRALPYFQFLMAENHTPGLVRYVP